MRRVARILVVDDILDMTEMLSLFLSRVGGYETRTANNGLEAIRVAEEFRPDIILLDIAMPNLDGFAIAKRIRSESWGRDILFIGMSGYFDSDKYERRAYEAEFVEYLPKPIALKRIMDAIEQFSHTVRAATSRKLPVVYSPPRAVARPVAERVHPVSFRAVFSRN